MRALLASLAILLGGCASPGRLLPETLSFPVALSHNLETDANTVSIGVTPLFRVKKSSP